MIKYLIVFLLSMACRCHGNSPYPFDYDLNIVTIPGTNGRTMVCLHGYGSNFQIAQILKMHKVTDSTLVSFNFPDHDIHLSQDHHAVSFGTIQELLPALYVLKQCIIDGGLTELDLYGFSAGGGAVVNVLGVLNTTLYDHELLKIGIGAEEKKQLLSALQNGLVILDVPLKSVEEIIDFRGSSLPLEILAQNYRSNQLRPIDSLERLQGLSLNILLYFQEPDEILSNRDDMLYIERLKQANQKGNTEVVIGKEGSHTAIHPLLWQAYQQKLESWGLASIFNNALSMTPAPNHPLKTCRV